MNAELKKQSLVLCIFLLSVTGCLSSNLHTFRPITSGQIYVETFTGREGPVVSNAIQIELQKRGMLANQGNAEFVLTGHSVSSFWACDSSSFELTDKNGVIFLSGTATSGGSLTVQTIGKRLAKKIVKKIQVKSDVSR